MTGFSLPENYTDNLEKLVRRTRPRVVPPLAILPAQEPIQEAPLVPEAMAEKTLREFSVPSTDNVATGPNVNVWDVNFELNQASSTWCRLAHSMASQMRTQMHIYRIFWSSATLLSYGVSSPTLSSFVCFPFSLLRKEK